MGAMIMTKYFELMSILTIIKLQTACGVMKSLAIVQQKLSNQI